MILQLIKMQENMQYDISKAVDSVTWSGSVLNAGQFCRVCVVKRSV